MQDRCELFRHHALPSKDVVVGKGGMQLVWVPGWWRGEHVAHVPNGLCLHLRLVGDVDPVHGNGAIIRNMWNLAPEGVVDHVGRLAAKDEVDGTLWFARAGFLGGLLDFVRCAQAAP